MYSDTFSFLQFASSVKLSIMVSDFVALWEAQLALEAPQSGHLVCSLSAFSCSLPALLCVRRNTRAYRHYIILVGMDAASMKAIV